MIDTQALTTSSAVAALAGGVLIGVAAVWLAWSHGRIAGISGILGALVDRLVQGRRDSNNDSSGWRVAFLLGLIVAPLVWRLFADLPPITPQRGPWGLLLGGLLVGLGTRYANGCTSGHGICGLSRGSRRSLVAVSVFMGVAMLTVFVSRHLLGGV